MILFKMLSRGVISEINGCISTGKEVSVVTNDVIASFSRYKLKCLVLLLLFLFVTQ